MEEKMKLEFSNSLEIAKRGT